MGYAFAQEALTATTQVLSLCAIFFVASAAASSAYLTVSEIFPVEMRAVSISLFYAIGTGAGGFIAPALFGLIVESGSRDALFGGFALRRCAHVRGCGHRGHMGRGRGEEATGGGGEAAQLQGLGIGDLGRRTGEPCWRRIAGLHSLIPSLCFSGYNPALAPVAHLDRVPGYEPGGRGFESLRARQSLTKLGTSPSFLFSIKPMASASRRWLPRTTSSFPSSLISSTSNRR